jgi:hypothetical protein
MKKITIKTSVGSYMATISKQEFLDIVTSWEKIVTIPLGDCTTYLGGEEYNDNAHVTFFLDNVDIQSIEEHDMELKEQINLSSEWTEQL